MGVRIGQNQLDQGWVTVVWLVLIKENYWNTTSFLHLQMSYGRFYSRAVELSTRDRDPWSHKPKRVTIWPFKKGQMTLHIDESGDKPYRGGRKISLGVRKYESLWTSKSKFPNGWLHLLSSHLRKQIFPTDNCILLCIHTILLFKNSPFLIAYPCTVNSSLFPVPTFFLETGFEMEPSGPQTCHSFASVSQGLWL